jgi:hypothetical protein
MPCLIVLIALLAPRVLIALIWLMSDWFSGIFASALWPILGFLFLPTTLLWYTAVHNWYGGAWVGWHIAVLIVAVIIDLSPAGGSRRRVD